MATAVAAAGGGLFNSSCSLPSSGCGYNVRLLSQYRCTIASSSSPFIRPHRSLNLLHSGLPSLSLSPSLHRRRPSSRSPWGGSAPVIRSAFLLECVGNIIKFITKGPSKLFVEKLEADLDKAAKFVKTSASLVAEVAKEVDEFAEKVESVAERAEEMANKVVQTTEVAEDQIEEILDVLDGDDSTDHHLKDKQIGLVRNPPPLSPDPQQSNSLPS